MVVGISEVLPRGLHVCGRDGAAVVARLLELGSWLSYSVRLLSQRDAEAAANAECGWALGDGTMQ